MAPLPDNNTALYNVTYTNAIASHTCQFRVSDDFGIQQEPNIAAVFQALGRTMSAATITGVTRQQKNTRISLPVANSTLIGQQFGAEDATLVSNARFISAIGRSTGGRKVRLSFFGWKDETMSRNFRYNLGETEFVGTLIDAIRNFTSPLLAIDGLPAIWYGYLNVGYNSYWQRNSR